MSVAAGTGRVAVLDAGAAANLVCFRLLGHHNRILGRNGFPRVPTYPARVRFTFAYGRLGEVRHAADFPVGIATNRGKFTAFASEAGMPALMRKGALEAPGGHLEFPRSISTLRMQGVDILLRVNRMGRFFLSAVAIG